MTADAFVDFEVRLIFRVGDEGQIARPRLLDAGDAHDVDLRVAFEAALQPPRDVSEPHTEHGYENAKMQMQNSGLRTAELGARIGCATQWRRARTGPRLGWLIVPVLPLSC